jgi:hypothetical protein
MIEGGAISWSNKQQPTIVFVNNQRQIHDKHPSYEGSHMDNNAHQGIRVHEKEEGDGDSM